MEGKPAKRRPPPAPHKVAGRGVMVCARNSSCSVPIHTRPLSITHADLVLAGTCCNKGLPPAFFRDLGFVTLEVWNKLVGRQDGVRVSSHHQPLLLVTGQKDTSCLASRCLGRPGSLSRGASATLGSSMFWTENCCCRSALRPCAPAGKDDP